jgi:hypothetical protein
MLYLVPIFNEINKRLKMMRKDKKKFSNEMIFL